MQATKQQQILGYFIEEAKEHLDTIEQGLLNLTATMADPEQINEMFRAAHSVKGGAAMLGFSSIQKVGHHLEDCFKQLKEHPVEIDHHLEDLFLKGFDTLKDLVEELQSPYGLREETAKKAVQAAEPIFVELQNNLTHRLKSRSDWATKVAAQSSRTPAQLSALLNGALKKMLELFKQGDTPAGRQQLAAFCSKLAQLSNSNEWLTLVQTAQRAIAQSRTPYQTLAPLIIRELKQAGDLLAAGRVNDIVPSRTLLQIALASAPTPAAPVSKPPVTTAPLQSGTKISIPAEPRAAARALLDAFNKEQLIEIAEFLMKAIQ